MSQRIQPRWSRRLAMLALVALAGCGGSNIARVTGSDQAIRTARTLAIAPPDGLFADDANDVADALGLELAKRGYGLVDAKAAAALLAKSNITPTDAATPPALAVLAGNGVDALVTVRRDTASLEGPGLRHIRVRLTSTASGQEVGGVDWNNSWGGMPGSIADAVMRKNANQAAIEIADALTKKP